MKNITKQHLREFKAIAEQAKKLNNRIEKLYVKTDNFNYYLNYQAITYCAYKLDQLLNHDYDSL